MTSIADEINLAAELLDASRGVLTTEGFNTRREALDAACAPHVPYMKRLELIEFAVAGLGEV